MLEIYSIETGTLFLSPASNATLFPPAFCLYSLAFVTFISSFPIVFCRVKGI